MRGYRRITGGLKEFDHTGFELGDTESTNAFKEAYKEWQSEQAIRKERAREIKRLYEKKKLLRNHRRKILLVLAIIICCCIVILSLLSLWW